MHSEPSLLWVKTARAALVGDRELDDLRILCPWVLPLAGGGFRAFYMGHGTACPKGTKGRILSARSEDGIAWTKEPGVRVDHGPGCEERALSPCVVPLEGGGYRMYFEAHAGGGRASTILSARSEDGLGFEQEAGVRLEIEGASVGSPRALLLDPAGRGVRLYFHRYPEGNGVVTRGKHVLSATAVDGLTFTRERGVRIAQSIDNLEREAVYCAAMVRLEGARVRAYYGAWNGRKTARGCVMTALSEDEGFSFAKEVTPCIEPSGPLDAMFASEPCVFQDAQGTWRMLYEAADATGATRILGAVASEEEA